MKLDKYIGIAIIIIFHIVGYVGFSNDALIDIFKSLVPVHLLLMFGIALYFQPNWNKAFIRFLLIVLFASYLIEMIGTNTGLIFGEYTYGATLGYSLFNTPLLIGVNWFILVYCTGIGLQYFKIKNDWLAALIIAFVLTGIDYLIEPVAIRFDYWFWQESSIPLQNYLAWFLISFAFGLLFRKSHFNKQNTPAIVILLVQTLFFILLNRL
jgi:bisanhydrobacterioruberin hydratase